MVVDDVRFSNEARAIRERGGRLIRLSRPGAATGKHASERSLLYDLCDTVIYNNGDEAALSQAVLLAIGTAVAQ